jgi:hypothetical protein
MSAVRSGQVQTQNRHDAKAVAGVRRPSALNQLRKSQMWAKFVLEQAQINGWESFPVQSSNQGQITVTQIPGSELHNGIHIYQGSYNKQLKTGERIAMREALSLAIHLKTTQPEKYREWEATYSAQ